MMNTEIEHINGFILPSENDIKNKLLEYKSFGIKLDIKCFAGYFSRYSHVTVKFKNSRKCELLCYKKANEIFMTWAYNIFGVDSVEYQKLANYKLKIENIVEDEQVKCLRQLEAVKSIKKLGKELIKDFNYAYFYLKHDDNYYNNTSQKCLVKLEQMFILYNFDSCRIEEFAKPSTPLIYCRDVFNWIDKITELKLDKVNQLKDYLDEYFQYLLDKPKCIWNINNINLPLKVRERDHMNITQYASYLNRKSIAYVTFKNKTQLCSSNKANEVFLTWFKSIFGEFSSESMMLESYRDRMENLSELVIRLGKKLIDNYDEDKKFSEKQQCLINLEQFIIRYDLPSRYVYEGNKKACKEKTYLVCDEAIDWINKITNKNDDKVEDLYRYINEYLYFIIERPKTIITENPKNINYRKAFRKFRIYI